MRRLRVETDLCFKHCSKGSVEMINAEFKRINTMPLQSRFLSQLDAEDVAAIKESIEDTTVGIFEHDATSRPEDMGIVLEGLQILQGLDNAALAAAMLFGLMYVLNLNYPPELKHTFEVLQKVVMELDGTTLSKKAQVLKNRL
ncbi:hypothetical protein N1851_015331 [Merluccius polli]|uniref:Uncharacterized protein n=1 Tax=Merluccius polli TaxID=89951 RepID=A0AA47MTG5_MERPO|nr:hypothetical protein N1851_015331 [Merluccius polli]